MPTDSQSHVLEMLLAGPSALAALPPDARTALARHLYHRHFAAGETIIRQGNTDKDLYLLGTGEARVTMHEQPGREVEVGRLRPGDVFGEWSLLTNRPRAATITATSEVDAYILHKEDYEIVLDSYLSLVQYLLRALSIRQREYAGLLAAEVNLWASAYGGMNKDRILTISFLSVAAAPSAPLGTLVSTAHFGLWATTMEGLANQPRSTTVSGQDEIQDCLAVVRGDKPSGDQRLGAALASIIDNLCTYPSFDPWRQNWLAQVENALHRLSGASISAPDGHEPAMELTAAYLATLHAILDSTATPELTDRLRTLDNEAVAAVGAAYLLQSRVSRTREAQRRPGYPVPEAGAREGRRAIERQLRAIDHRAKRLPKSARDSTSAVVTLTRLLAQYFLGFNQMRPQSAALPYNL